MLVALKCERSVEYLPASLITVRFLSCFVMFYLIDGGVTIEEKKKMRESIILVLLTLTVNFSSNTRIDMLYTIPFGIIFNIIIMQRSLEDDG